MVAINYNKMCIGCGQPLGDNVVCDFNGSYHPECNPINTPIMSQADLDELSGAGDKAMERLNKATPRQPDELTRENLERLEGEIERLRDALRDFGDHNPLCKHLRPYTCIEMRPACDCGWNEIFEPSVGDTLNKETKS